jgi:hypothetical protein
MAMPLGMNSQQATPVNVGKKNIGNMFSALSPQQNDVKNQSLMQVMSLLQGGTSPLLQNQQQSAQKNFYSNTLPTIAERFTSFGSGSQRSSAFQNAVGRAGTNLEDQNGDRAIQLLMSLLGPSLQDTNIFQKNSPSFLENISGGIGESIPAVASVAFSLLMKYLTGGAV